MKIEITLVILFLLVGAFLPLTFQSASAVSPSNWPMYRGDLTHDGYSTNPSTATTNDLLWNFTTDGPVSASPTIVDDRVYIGSLSGTAYCLNAKDGSIIWNYAIQAVTQGLYGAGGPAIGSSMAVDNGRLYFGSYDTNVYCLDTSTGNKVWNYSTGNTVESSPTVSDGHVYVGSWDGSVYCLDAISGTKVWSYQTGSQVESTPAVTDGKVFVGSVDGSVYCLEAGTGNKTWSFATGNLVQSSPAVVNGRVYIGSEDTNIYCLDASTGDKVWNYTTEAWVDSSPAVANGYVYVGCAKVDAAQNDLPSNIYCLDASTGDKVWNFTMKGGASYSSPAITDDFLYMGDWAHNVYCLNLKTGKEIWNYTTGNYVNSSPAIANGNVFIASWDRHVYCFGTQSTTTPLSSFILPLENTQLVAIAVFAIIIIAAILFLIRRKNRPSPS